MLMKKNVTYNLKVRLEAGERVFGQFIGPGGNPERVVNELISAGFEFIMIDIDHGLVNKETVFEYVRLSMKYEIPIFLRPEEHFANFRCYLDAGVNGMVLPRVQTVEDVSAVVSKSYFPPMGNKGQSIGSNQYMVDFQNTDEVPFLDLVEYVNNNTVLFPMAENLECIQNLPRILKLDGVTATLVGTTDLALSVGGINPNATSRQGLPSSDAVQAKIRQVLQICKEAGKVAGISGMDA
jgi:2-keto-3-deoxy-L-rhamnonate aldolase RhmA